MMNKIEFYSVMKEVNNPNYPGFKKKYGKEKKEKAKMPIPDYNDEGIMKLRDAIVDNEADLYRKAIRKCNKKKAKEQEEWFLGEDFESLSLSRVDGDGALRDIRRVVKEDYRIEKKKLSKKLDKLKKEEDPQKEKIEELQKEIKKIDRIIRFINRLEDES